MGQKVNSKGFRVAFLQQNFFFKTNRFFIFNKDLNSFLFNSSFVNNYILGNGSIKFIIIKNLIFAFFLKNYCIINNIHFIENSLNFFFYVEFYCIKNVFGKSTFDKKIFIFQKHLEVVFSCKKPISFVFIEIKIIIDTSAPQYLFFIKNFVQKRFTKNFIGLDSLFFLGYLSNYFPISCSFSKLTAYVLEKNIKHQAVIDILQTLFDFFFQSNTCKIDGVRMQIKGRINGVDIAKKHIFQFGAMPAQTITRFIDYGFAIANTPYGTLGIKLWIYKKTVLLMYIKPKNVKYQKVQKSVLKIRDFKRTTKKNSIPIINSFSFFSKVSGFFMDKHLETGKKILKNILSHNNIYVLKVFPHKPITKKPLGVRMGKGKGAVSNWVVPVTFGSIIFEIRNVTFSKAFQAFQKIKKKIPLPIGFREKKQPLYLFIIRFLMYFVFYLFFNLF